MEVSSPGKHSLFEGLTINSQFSDHFELTIIDSPCSWSLEDSSEWSVYADEGTNAIAQARTPQARPSGPAREKNFHYRFFRIGGKLISGSRLPPPPHTRQRRQNEPRAELLRLQETHPSRNGLHAMPRQILHNKVKQVASTARN